MGPAWSEPVRARRGNRIYRASTVCFDKRAWRSRDQGPLVDRLKQVLARRLPTFGICLATSAGAASGLIPASCRLAIARTTSRCWKSGRDGRLSPAKITVPSMKDAADRRGTVVCQPERRKQTKGFATFPIRFRRCSFTLKRHRDRVIPRLCLMTLCAVSLPAAGAAMTTMPSDVLSTLLAEKPELPKRVLVLGSGALQIGQAGEFDYSGSQACKALREEGIYVVLFKPEHRDGADVGKAADAVYFLPVEPNIVEEVLVREQCDAILLGFGGQSALNCGLRLSDEGILARHGVRVLGTSIETIRACEDRKIFADKLREIVARRSWPGCNLAARSRAAADIGYPLILRAGFRWVGVDRRSSLRTIWAGDRASAGRRRTSAARRVPQWLERDRIRAGPRRCRQLHHHLQHGKLRSDGRPHRRINRRGTVADAFGCGLSAVA